VMAKRFHRNILEPLGYKFEKEDERSRLNQVLTPAITLARLVAKQRAIFRFYVPSFETSEVKAMGDKNLTNVDDEFPDLSEELKGNIWFVIQPGLVKFGTGKGEKLHERTVLKGAYVELVKEATEDID
jgi:hypothetical protein